MSKNIKTISQIMDDLTEVADALRLKSIHDTFNDDLYELAEVITECLQDIEIIWEDVKDER